MKWQGKETPWTPEKIEALRKLADTGLSAAQMAVELGGVTRNAVIGKCSRLGLKYGGNPLPRIRRPRPRKPRAPRTLKGTRMVEKRELNRQIAEAAPIDKAEAFNAEAFIALTNRQPKALLELGPHECRWPVGEMFCGDATINTRRPYCASHTGVGRDPNPYGNRRTPDQVPANRSNR